MPCHRSRKSGSRRSPSGWTILGDGGAVEFLPSKVFSTFIINFWCVPSDTNLSPVLCRNRTRQWGTPTSSWTSTWGSWTTRGAARRLPAPCWTWGWRLPWTGRASTRPCSSREGASTNGPSRHKPLIGDWGWKLVKTDYSYIHIIVLLPPTFSPLQPFQ